MVAAMAAAGAALAAVTVGAAHRAAVLSGPSAMMRGLAARTLLFGGIGAAAILPWLLLAAGIGAAGMLIVWQPWRRRVRRAATTRPRAPRRGPGPHT